MLRPRDSHDLRLIETRLDLSPPASIRWIHDVFGNSIAVASFTDMTTELRIESILRLETLAARQPEFQITAEAVSYPFIYSADDRIDLGRLLDRHYPDPTDRVGSWARGFVRSNPTDTLALLADLNNGVSAWVSYESRDIEGIQTPIETLNRGRGSCRDLRAAWASEPASYRVICTVPRPPRSTPERPTHGPTSMSRARVGSPMIRQTARLIAAI
jgi:hypothetical protein